MILTKGLTVSGQLHSSYSFENEAVRTQWIQEEFPKLEAEYGPLQCHLFDLDGLKVGDTCRVYGEGCEEFLILQVFTYSPHRHGFSLDSGWTEEVVKCYRHVDE